MFSSWYNELNPNRRGGGDFLRDTTVIDTLLGETPDTQP